MGIEFNFTSGITETENAGRQNAPAAEAGGRQNTDTAPAAESAGGNTAPAEKVISAKVNGRSIEEIPVVEIPKKPRKQRESKAPKTDTKLLEANIGAVVQGAYSLLAKAMDAPYFEITTEDAAKVSAPLSRIFERMDLTDTMNKYGDGIALVTALVVITAPKVMMYSALHPKKETRKGATNNVTTKAATGSSRQTGNVDNADTSANAPADSVNISSPWLGGYLQPDG